MKSRFLRVLCSLMILLVIAGSVVVVSRSQETTEVCTTEVIRSPLSTMPAPVLVGQQFTVTVAVDPSAQQWGVAIESKYDIYGLNVLPLDYDSSEEIWRVNATVSTNVQPGLYALKVSVVVNGKNNTYTQPRSVWVMSHYPQEFRIAHLTDFHYTLNPDHLRQAVAQVNFLRPTVAIITGDQVDIGYSESEVRDFWTALQDADFPTYCLPGNHDYKGDGKLKYIKYEGPLNYSVDMGFAYFVALDTDDRGYVTVDQIRWAGRMLSTVAESKFKIIGFHHPFFSDASIFTAMNITGSWESIEDLMPRMYYSWKDSEEGLEAAKEFLRMVQEHTVNLILQGHIHRDVMFILNQENYFVVTGPVGGPPVPGTPYGYRMITVDDSRITDLTYLNRPFSTFITSNESHSIPLGLFKVSCGPENDGSTAAVTAVLRNNWGEAVDGRLEMALSKEYPVDRYTTFPEAVPYSVVVGPSAHYFRFNLTLSPGEGLRFTVATAPDSTPPRVGPPNVKVIPLGPKYSVKLQPEITDAGWGVENATLLYLLEGAADWEEVAMTRSSGDMFESSISGIPINETVSYRIIAYDYAGHKVETESRIVSSQQTTTSATETTPIETTTATTPTTTTLTTPLTPSTPATTETSTYLSTSTPSTTTETTSAYPTTTVTTSPTPSTTEGPPAETNVVVIAAVFVVVIAVLAVALLIRRRSSQPGKS